MLRRMKIGTRVNLLIAVPLLALLALTWVSYSSLERASVRGDQYKELKAAESLRNAIVPPPANLLRAWMAVNHISVLVSSPVSDRTNLEIIDAQTELKDARLDYNTAVAYWRDQPLDAVTKSAFEASADAGAAFFAKVDNQLTPAMVSRDPDKVISAVRSLGDDYAVQQVKIFRANDLVDKLVAEKENKTDDFVGRVIVLLAASVATLLLICLLTAYLVRRSIVRPIRALSERARRVADTDLPTAVHKLQSLPADAPKPEIAPFVVSTHDELADLSVSFTSVQNAALDLAVEQAMARRIVSDNLVNIARRTQTLLGRSLTALSDMEQSERDPETLENLFHLDHLSTRMRRNAQSLLVLAGAEQNRLWSPPLPVGDVVRAAVSEIESYARVELGDLGVAGVQGALAPEIAHLLAELLENATHFSPPSSKVMVVGRSFPDGHQIAVVDYGIGVSVSELQEANSALRRHSDFANSSSKMLGFQVVARIANKHGIDVILAQTAGATGVTAIIKLPSSVLDSRPGPVPDPTVLPAPPAGLDTRPSVTAPVAAPAPAPAPVPVMAGAIAGPSVVGERSDWVSEEPAPTMSSVPTMSAVPTMPAAPLMPALQPLQTVTAQNGLTKRVRGAQLPDLGVVAEPDQSYERPAEQVRNTLSSLQRGTERSRQDLAE